MKPVLVMLISVCVLSHVGSAQTAGAQKILTNQDIAVLAKAGFTEEFIVNTIMSEKSHFDTSAAGLAELANEGLNERVVRAMAGVGAGWETGTRPAQPSGQSLSQPAAQSAVQSAAQPGASMPYPEEMTVPGNEQRTRVHIVQPTRAGLAIAAQTPYYESTSLLFGLYHKKVGVGAVPRMDQIISPQLGPGSNSSRMMANFPTLVAPAGSAVRYVVIP
jgi:hypothetical protein